MKLPPTLILALLCVATLQGFTRGDDDVDEGFERYLRQVLDNFQREMKNGISELKIPPLDPLDLRRDHIDIRPPNVGYLKIRDLVVHGLSTLDIRDVKAKLSIPEAGIRFNLEHVKAQGTYDLNMKIAKIFPITGNGNFHIQLERLGVFAKICMSTANFQQFEVRDIDFDISVGKININLENIIDPKLAPTLNKIVNGYGTFIVNALLPKLKAPLRDAIVKVINKEIKGIDISKLLEKLG